MRPPALSSDLPAIDGVFHEVCAGNGTLSHCVAHHGLAAGTLSEADGPKAAALPLAFPAPARVVGDAMTTTGVVTQRWLSEVARRANRSHQAGTYLR